MTTVLLVDDHSLVRAGLTTLIATTDDLEIIGEAGGGEQAVTLAGELEPDVVLMDLKRVADALAAGAVGYLLKDCDGREVLAAIRSAALGHAPLDPRVARALLPSATPRIKDALSIREMQVLRLVAKGLANKQIGRSLGISERTVKVHVTHVFRRIGVTDRTSAAMWARDNLDADGQD